MNKFYKVFIKLKFLSLTLSTSFLLSSLAIPTTANAKTIVDDNKKTLAYCEISDPGGFYAEGNCKKVLKAYRAMK